MTTSNTDFYATNGSSLATRPVETWTDYYLTKKRDNWSYAESINRSASGRFKCQVYWTGKQWATYIKKYF